MARKEPFKRISVSDRIYEALDKKRLEETKDEFRPLPMNAYAEKILWDYAQGKITLVGSAQSAESKIVTKVEGGVYPHSRSDEAGKASEEKPDVRKRTRPNE